MKRILSFFGSLKSSNAKLNDEMATLRFERDVLAWANKELKADLKAARAVIAADQPLVAYALKRKDAVKKYQDWRKRREWDDKFFTEYVNVGKK